MSKVYKNKGIQECARRKNKMEKNKLAFHIRTEDEDGTITYTQNHPNCKTSVTIKKNGNKIK